MSANNEKKRALDYHSEGRPGKIEVKPTKPTNTQSELSLAYSPGVAEPCKAIEENKEEVFTYTAKGNKVAVISNGTAVLGLGNIGAEASKPVMEGKGVLFKVFADVDVFDLELNAENIDDFVTTVRNLAPTFGGINLEDIKAPECFEIERRLKEETDIPIMHDDQHGTAIIAGAGLLNALELADKKIEDVKVVVNGAGASAIACSRFIQSLGVNPDNLIMLDRQGVIKKDRENLDKYRGEFATDKPVNTLEEAMVGADVFLGLSTGNIVSPEMLKSMADNPIVFAMANPIPEIDYPDAMEAREDVIMATGRSDYPNQINNVLGFPFIFRGALDVRATDINEEMKVAAAKALAHLAKKPVPEVVNKAYDNADFQFGRDYIIPKPMDPRLITQVAPAVAKAAIATGVNRTTIEDWEQYNSSLRERIGLENNIVRAFLASARKDPKRVVFTEADNIKILKAANRAYEEGYAYPILLGAEDKIQQMIRQNHLSLQDSTIINPLFEYETRKEFGKMYFDKRKRKGLTRHEATQLMKHRNYYGMMMMEKGYADALISGLTKKYTDSLLPAIQIIGKKPDVKVLAGLYIMITKRGPVFIADATTNINPDADTLVDITEQTCEAVRQFNIEPNVGMLSYSNFGSGKGEEPEKVSLATQKLKNRNPGMMVDGEIQANFAVNNELKKEFFDFSELTDRNVNTLIFPNLAAGNISYKLLQELGGIEAIGPLILGLNKSVNILQMGSSIEEIVNMTAYAVMDAQTKQSREDVSEYATSNK